MNTFRDGDVVTMFAFAGPSEGVNPLRAWISMEPGQGGMVPWIKYALDETGVIHMANCAHVEWVQIDKVES